MIKAEANRIHGGAAASVGYGQVGRWVALLGLGLSWRELGFGLLAETGLDDATFSLRFFVGPLTVAFVFLGPSHLG